MTTASLSDRAVQLRGDLIAKAAQRDHHEAQRAALAASINDTEADVRAADVALALVHTIRDAETVRVQGRLAELCTEALRTVFDDPSLALEIAMVERRGVVEADIMLRRGDLITDPLEGNGGGLVADLAAMLRLIMTRLLKARGVAGLLVLDEPFAALSEGHREAMAATLEEIAATLGMQVIVVTHADEFARGSVYRVRWRDRDALEAEVVREDRDD